MNIGIAAAQAIAGLACLGLSLLLTGVVSRPLVTTGLVLLVFAALNGRRDVRRQIRAFIQQQQAVAAGIAILLIGLLGYWAFTPGVQRYQILGKLETFSSEGRQMQDELAARASSNQLMGDYTARVQDWHQRLETWINDDMGPFYKQRLGTPPGNLTYPPQMPARLRVFWDRLQTDLGAMEQFRKEFSSWFFKPSGT